MPERKLSYKVDVDTGQAVSDLARLGTAGADAGKDIAKGFDSAKSASEQALAALSAKLDQVESDAKGAAGAVAAIKANLTVDVDDSKVNGFVSDLKNKMGVAFDDVTADAKQFAAVLERGVDMSKTTSEILGVGDELGHVRTESDQSRSVLANLAGNATQDLGQLGGVVGSLGVGIGQLAEYAVDGNIAMSGLAKVAGPMAALSAATLLVSQYTQNVAETKAWERDQVDGYTDAINGAGDSIAAVLEMANNGLTGRIRDTSILGGLLDKEKTVDLIDLLDKAGVSLNDVQAAIRSGAHNRTEFSDWLNGTTPEAAAVRASFDDLANSGTQYTAVLEGVLSNTIAYTTAAEHVDATNRVMASSIDSVNESLRGMRIDADPLAVLSEGAIKFGQVMVDPVLLWRQLVADLRDGKADTINTAQAIDAFAAATGKSKEEIEALAVAQGEAAKSAGDLQTKTKSATGAANDQADAVRGQVDALQALIDKQNDMLSATDDLAKAQQEWDDGLAAFPDTVAASTAAMDLATAGSPEWVAARNDQRDALEQLVEQYVSATELQARANGQQLTASQRVDAQARALGQLAGTLDSDTIPAVAAYYASLFKIPESRLTDFEMVLATGDQAAIEQFVADNSGTKVLAIAAEADAAKLAKVNHDVGAVTGPRAVPVTAVAYTSTAQANLYALTGPMSVKVGADTSSADSTMSWWRRIQGSTAVTVPIHTRVSTSGGTSGYIPGASPYAAGVAATAAPTAAVSPASTSGAVAVLAAPPPAPITINLSAGVVGNRYDLARWLRAATRDQQRLGRMP